MSSHGTQKCEPEQPVEAKPEVVEYRGNVFNVAEHWIGAELAREFLAREL